jgi:hypothetical protein
MAYALNLYVLVAAYATLAMALSFFSGRTGYISLLHAGFFGLGAYTNAILLMHFEVPPPIGWLAAAVAGGAIAFAISRPLFRTRGDYFAILTIVVQVAFGLLLVNADSITNGPLGLAAIPQWPFSYGPLVAPVLFSALANAHAEPRERCLLDKGDDLCRLGRHLRRGRCALCSVSIIHRPNNLSAERLDFRPSDRHRQWHAACCGSGSRQRFHGPASGGDEVPADLFILRRESSRNRLRRDPHDRDCVKVPRITRRGQRNPRFEGGA